MTPENEKLLEEMARAGWNTVSKVPLKHDDVLAEEVGYVKAALRVLVEHRRKNPCTTAEMWRTLIDMTEERQEAHDGEG